MTSTLLKHGTSVIEVVKIHPQMSTFGPTDIKKSGSKNDRKTCNFSLRVKRDVAWERVSVNCVNLECVRFQPCKLLSSEKCL